MMRYRSLVLATALLAALAPRIEAQQVYTFASPAARRAWLGFSFEATEARRPGERILTLTITSIVDDSPAQKAGLREGDTILRINNLNATEDLLGTLGTAMEPGDTVSFRIRRSNREQEVRVIAAKPPADYQRRVAVLPRGTEAMTRMFIDSARAHFDTTFFRRLPNGDSALARVFIWGDSAAGFGGDTVRFRKFREQALRMDSVGVGVFGFPGDSIRARVFSRAFPADSLHFFNERAGERVFSFSTPGDLPGHDIVVRGWGFGVRGIAGAELQDLNPELARYFRVDGGVLVVNVPENTPARRAGLRSGDVITSVESTSVTNVEQVRRQIDRTAGASVKLGIVRQGEKQTVQLKK